MSTEVEQEQGKTVIDTAKDEKLQEMPQNTKEKANKVPELSNWVTRLLVMGWPPKQAH